MVMYSIPSSAKWCHMHLDRSAQLHGNHSKNLSPFIHYEYIHLVLTSRLEIFQLILQIMYNLDTTRVLLICIVLAIYFFRNVHVRSRSTVAVEFTASFLRLVKKDNNQAQGKWVPLAEYPMPGLCIHRVEKALDDLT